ncbi:MAG: UxaA family hydrolase, partial [Mycobacteriales bacterium]
MTAPVVLAGGAVLPTGADNCAIATRELPPGARVTLTDGSTVRVAHAVPEGHRFSVATVPPGAALASWGLPFGSAVLPVAPGDYLATERMLDVLRARRSDLTWPAGPNFENRPLDPYVLESGPLAAVEQIAPVGSPGTFLGYDRGATAGTRNHIVILGTSAATGPFAEAVAARFAGAPLPDPVVAVAHTEGSDGRSSANLDLLVRTLTGFARHPNVGAVLIVDEPGSLLTAAALASYAADRGYPAPTAQVAALRRRGALHDDIDRAAATVTGWIPRIGAQRRTEIPLSRLNIALQCGGSDAFSGVSANPLAAAVGAEVIRHGGVAELAETDELTGAESYLLDRVRDAGTARQFLDTIAAFAARVRAHGHTTEGNVSGGNIMRGLYNITLKSLGAARKRDPRVRLDHVIDYAEPIPGPGYTFMNSPGNDLESVAGQVASGCNLIFFTTGNGSITNFPFVPTVKFVSTSRRYELLAAEMD